MFVSVMKMRSLAGLMAGVISIGLLVSVAAAQPATKGPKIVGYYPAWTTHARNFQVADIPAQNLTHAVSVCTDSGP